MLLEPPAKHERMHALLDKRKCCQPLPLTYHCGSVWPHDAGIAIEGMLRAGLVDSARVPVHRAPTSR